MKRARALGASGLLLTAGLALAATDPAPPAPFGETIDVRAVNVEAVVTDSSGKRVRGLTAADFRLLVDDHEVPIDFFTEIVDSQAAAPPAAAVEAGAPAPQAPVSGAVGRSLLVFIDESLSFEAALEIVLKRLQDELKALGPEDQVAVVAFNGMRLEVLSGWSRDRTALAAVLAAARLRPAYGIYTLVEREGLDRDRAFGKAVANAADGPDEMASVFPDGAAASDPKPGQSSYLEATALDSLAGVPPQAGSRQSRVGAAVIAALRSFASAPGRKAALLLAGGWELGEAPDAFLRLIQTANLLGYTLYPVDVPGIASSPAPVDIRLSPVDLTEMTGSAMNLNTTYSFITSDLEQEEDHCLEVLARETGGKASLNSNRLVALDRALTDTSSYYWLGFTPTWRADGRRHGIRVEARRPGLKVRSRGSYTDLTREVDQTMQMESRLVVGDAVPDRRLRVELGAPRFLSRRIMEVDVTLGIPADALPPSLTPGGYQVEMPLRVAALEGGGERVELRPLRLRIELDQPPPTSGYARFQATLRLRRRNQTLQLALYDAVGGTLFWGEAEVAVDDAGTTKKVR